MHDLRMQSLRKVKTYKTIKNVIWQGTIKYDKLTGAEVPQKDRAIDLQLLLGLMDEI